MESLSAILIVFLPLAGALINLLLLSYEILAKKEDEHLNPIKIFSGIVSCLAVAIPFLLSLSIFGKETIRIEFFNWIPLEGYKITFSALFDNLSKVSLLYITGVSSLIHIYSVGYMSHDRGFIRYFMLLNLFVFFMIQIVVSENLVQIFLGWEGVGLCSYALIGFWYSGYENARAGFKAFIVNRVGDFGFLVGIALFLIYTGGVDYSLTKNLPSDKVFFVALALSMGAMGKSAQGPFWLWLPDAMRGPTPVSALIHAATMVTAGVYMVVRLQDLFSFPSGASDFVFWIGTITSILMGFFGIFERDIKRILAFSTLSQLGLMFAGAGTSFKYTGMFHVFEHSFFKAALFLISGILMHEFENETDIYKLKEKKPLEKGMTLSALGFLISALAMSGVFPLSGYWSKESIIQAVSHDFGHTGSILMLIASFITPLYMFRAYFIVFGNQKFKLSFSPSHEGGYLMFIPVLVLVILSVIGGIFDVGGWLGKEYGYQGEIHGGVSPVVVHVVVFLSVFISYIIWGRGKEIPESGAGKILWRKLYLNEIEEYSFIGSAVALMKLIYSFAERIIVEGFYLFLSVLARVIGYAIASAHGGEPVRILFLIILGITFVLFIV